MTKKYFITNKKLNNNGIMTTELKIKKNKSTKKNKSIVDNKIKVICDDE